MITDPHVRTASFCPQGRLRHRPLHRRRAAHRRRSPAQNPAPALALARSPAQDLSVRSQDPGHRSPRPGKSLCAGTRHMYFISRSPFSLLSADPPAARALKAAAAARTLNQALSVRV